MRRTGVALLSVVAVGVGLSWWLSRVEVEERNVEQAASPLVTPKATLVEETLPRAPETIRVEGEIIDAEKRSGIANAVVRFEHDDGSSSVRTDERGHFAFQSPGPGTVFIVAVSAAGYVGAEDEREFDASTPGVRVELKALSLRRGRVVDVAGRPIEGALIEQYSLVLLAAREGAPMLSDDKGEFQLSVDPAGEDRLHVSHACCISAEVLVEKNELVITLQPSKIERVRFSGVVVDEDDRSVSGAMVEGIATAGEAAHSFSVTTDARGAFSTEVPAGAKIELEAHLGASASGSQTASASEQARLVLLERAGALSGRVTNEQGQPLTRFTVSLHGEFSTQLDVTSADGAFELDGLPRIGRSALMITSVEYLVSAPRYVSLARGEHAGGNDFVLKRGRSISGVVFDRHTRQPLAAANVRITESVGPRLGSNGRARSDTLGRFVLAGLPAGRVEVQISRSGYLNRQEVFDTANQAELRIGLTSTSSLEAKEEYVGVGMKFASGHEPDAGPGGYLVESLHPQGGALVAGVKPGDEILAADGVQAGSMSTPEFLRQIKGPEGSMVTLTVRREGNTFDAHVIRRQLGMW